MEKVLERGIWIIMIFLILFHDNLKVSLKGSVDVKEDLSLLHDLVDVSPGSAEALSHGAVDLSPGLLGEDHLICLPQ